MKKGWKNSVCGNCGNAKYKVIFGGDGYQIVECTGCGLARTMSRSDAAKEYDSSYFDRKPYIEALPRFKKIFRRQFRFIEKYVQPGSLLDVGAGVGTMMHVAAGRGWEVDGVEIVPTGPAFAKEEFGLNVRVGDIDVVPDNNRYDLIIFNHVLEHVPDLNKALSRTGMLLNEEGYVVIGVPNFASWRSGWERQSWISLQPQEHLWQFTPSTLTALMEKHGFERKAMLQESHVTRRPDKYLVNLIANRAGFGEAMMVVFQKKLL